MNLTKTLAFLAKRKITLPVETSPDKLLRRLNVIRMGFEADDEGEEKAEKETEGEGGLEGDKAFKKALQYLEGQGVHLPPDTTPENFVERLCVACHALENSTNPGGDEVTTEPKGGAGQGTPTPAPDAGPVMMSLQKRVATFEKRALKLESESLDRRIAELRTTGRINKPLADKLKASLATERLSLSDDGTLAPCKLLAQVEAYEQLDAGSANVLLGDNRPSPVNDPESEAPKKPDNAVVSRLTRGRFVINGDK